MQDMYDEEFTTVEADVSMETDELTQAIYDSAEKLGMSPKEFMQAVADKLKDMREFANQTPVLDQLIAEAEGSAGKSEKAPAKNREDRDI